MANVAQFGDAAIVEERDGYQPVGSSQRHWLWRHPDQGWQVFTYHSHPKTAAEPSQTDINVAQYPNWLNLIVSLADEPVVRAWRIDDGRVEEEEIVVE